MSRRRSKGGNGRRRNPFGLDAEVAKVAAWAIAGGIAARSGPQMLLPAQNDGVMGYALNIGTTIAASMLAGRFIGPSAAKGVMIGGLVATGGRIVEDQFGKKLVEFTSFGLGSDPGYQLGEYAPASFPLPNQGGMPALAAPANGGANQFSGF